MADNLDLGMFRTFCCHSSGDLPEVMHNRGLLVDGQRSSRACVSVGGRVVRRPTDAACRGFLWWIFSCVEVALSPVTYPRTQAALVPGNGGWAKMTLDVCYEPLARSTGWRQGAV